MMKKFSQKSRSPSSKRSVRFWALGSLSLLLVVAVALAVAAHLSWNNHQTEVEAHYQQAKQLTNATLESDLLTVMRLNDYRDKLGKNADELCRQGALGQMYRKVVASAEAAHQTCLKDASKLTKLSDQAQRVTSLIASERTVNKILLDAQSDINSLEPSQFAEISARWNRVGEELKKVNVDKQFEPVLVSVKKSITALTTGYSKLVEANKNQTRVEFDNAMIDIKNAHAELTDTARQYEAVLNTQVSSLVRHAKAL